MTSHTCQASPGWCLCFQKCFHTFVEFGKIGKLNYNLHNKKCWNLSSSVSRLMTYLTTDRDTVEASVTNIRFHKSAVFQKRHFASIHAFKMNLSKIQSPNFVGGWDICWRIPNSEFIYFDFKSAEYSSPAASVPERANSPTFQHWFCRRLPIKITVFGTDDFKSHRFAGNS